MRFRVNHKDKKKSSDTVPAFQITEATENKSNKLPVELLLILTKLPTEVWFNNIVLYIHFASLYI
jgi:hypothetical protein